MGKKDPQVKKTSGMLVGLFVILVAWSDFLKEFPS